MDVIVIGGGIVGLSAAYYLSERGANVTLYENGSLGAGSTARAAGGIRSQFSTAVNVELSLASKSVWDSFDSAFGVDIGLRKNGYLFLARTEATADRFREDVRMQQNLGAESVYITPDEATEHCPGLDPEPFVAATYDPDDAAADPNLAVQGYAGAAREEGVDIRTGTGVTAIRREGKRVVGVEVENDGGTDDSVRTSSSTLPACGHRKSERWRASSCRFRRADDSSPSSTPRRRFWSPCR